MNIILIDLKNPKEVEKFISFNPASNEKLLDSFIKEGRTEIGFDESSGDIIMAIQKGKFIHLEGRFSDINFKRITNEKN